MHLLKHLSQKIICKVNVQTYYKIKKTNLHLQKKEKSLFWGEGIVRELGKVIYTLLRSKWIINKDLLYSTGNSAQCYMAAWMGGEFEEEWIHEYAWLSCSTVRLKLLQHC